MNLCPLCKSENTEKHIIEGNNKVWGNNNCGIWWEIDSYWVCNECGIMFQPKNK